ncbi:MAG: class I SAM-dependent methyltransferase [Candidatus Latescibacter sp.]|nr:class I SAM-dependent methyltransferase [Candidatus Latescibacter sp.]
MRKFKSTPYNLAYLAFRWIQPFFNPMEFFPAFPRYIRYFRDWLRYSRMNGAESIRFSDTYPCIHERTPATGFDRHYFYQDIWAFRKIVASGAGAHVDIGSRVDYVGFLTAVTHVTFIDIRPLEAALENFESKKGSILAIPFEDRSIPSLSCLHVAEHIGLGRYGDPLDPYGTQKACRELSRVLAPGGNLYFSLPVGKPRLCFNGQRIHSPGQILEYFSGLRLVELSGINDDVKFTQNIDRSVLENADYGCGLFHFTKD